MTQAFLENAKPMTRHTARPMSVPCTPYAPMPAAELAVPRLCAMAAPASMPRAKMAASLSPSPAMKSCLPGHPPASAKARPAVTMPRKFHRPSVCRHAEEQMSVPEENKITERAHGAEAAALGKRADDDRHAEGQKERSMGSAGAAHGIEQRSALRLSGNLREGKIQAQKSQHEQGEEPACGGVLPDAAAERIAALEEQRAQAYAADKPGKTEQRVAVTAGKAENGAPRTAEKDQCADGCNHAENESDDGRGAAAGPELADHERHAHGTEHEADILHDGSAMQTETARDVAFKAGHAYAHVGGIAEFLQQYGCNADKRADEDDAGGAGKGILAVHEKAPP